MELFIAIISVFFTVLVIDRLCDAIDEEPGMKYVIIYFIENWLLILAVLVLKIVSLMGQWGNDLIESYGKPLTLAYLASFFLVTVYGSYAILYDRFFGEQCLNFFSFTIIMIIHIYIYAFYYSLISFVLKAAYERHE